MDKPERKNNRIAEFDYASANYFFVTLCVDKRRKVLSSVCRGDPCGRPVVSLFPLGKIAEETFKETERRFGVEFDCRVIMPDHIHFVLIVPPQRATARVAPTLGQIVGAYKSIVSKKWRDYCRETGTEHFSVWQRNYYEHVIRNRQDLDETRRYIDNNPSGLLQK